MSDDVRPVMRRTFQAPLEVKEGRIVEGCCVPYGEATKVRDSPDGPAYYERFEPGAFRKHLNAANRIELRYEHRDDLAHSVGVGRALYEEARGLFGTFLIHAGAFGDQALELVRAGILPGFSISFSDRFTQWKRAEDQVVVRESCELHEVSLVRQPAYAGAVVTAVRSRAQLLGELELPAIADEQLERLRSVGIEV